MHSCSTQRGSFWSASANRQTAACQLVGKRSGNPSHRQVQQANATLGHTLDACPQRKALWPRTKINIFGLLPIWVSPVSPAAPGARARTRSRCRRAQHSAASGRPAAKSIAVGVVGRDAEAGRERTRLPEPQARLPPTLRCASPRSRHTLSTARRAVSRMVPPARLNAKRMRRGRWRCRAKCGCCLVASSAPPPRSSLSGQPARQPGASPPGLPPVFNKRSEGSSGAARGCMRSCRQRSRRGAPTWRLVHAAALHAHKPRLHNVHAANACKQAREEQRRPRFERGTREATAGAAAVQRVARSAAGTTHEPAVRGDGSGRRVLRPHRQARCAALRIAVAAKAPCFWLRLQTRARQQRRRRRRQHEKTRRTVLSAQAVELGEQGGWGHAGAVDGHRVALLKVHLNVGGVVGGLRYRGCVGGVCVCGGGVCVCGGVGGGGAQGSA